MSTQIIRAFGAAALGASLLFAVPASADDHAESTTKPAEPTAPAWNVDPVHSSIVFEIGHNGVGRVFGRFNELEGTIHFAPDDLEGSRIHIMVPIASIDTNHDGRDNHLRSPDYFNAEENTIAEFKSTKIEKGEGENQYTVTGDLTMMGKTEELTTTFTWNGVNEARGRTITGAGTEFVVDRVAWGVGGEGGLSQEVKVYVGIEAIKAES